MTRWWWRRRPATGPKSNIHVRNRIAGRKLDRHLNVENVVLNAEGEVNAGTVEGRRVEAWVDRNIDFDGDVKRRKAEAGYGARILRRRKRR